MVELRQIVNDLIEYQLEDYPQEAIEAKQQELNTAYDAFVESNNMTPQMSKKAKRLVLFAPDVYPWKEIDENFENTMRREMNKGNGGAELDIDDIIKMLSCSIA